MFVQLLLFHCTLSITYHFGYCFCQSARLFELKVSLGNHMSVVEWADTYGIHHWRILWSSYRKLAWVGFEPTTNEFLSGDLTDWRIRPCLWSTALMWLPQATFNSNKRSNWQTQRPKRNVTLSKQWNWSNFTKLALSASGTRDLIGQSVRASESNSVVLGSNPTQVNFLQLLQRVLQWWIPHASAYSATLMWLPQDTFNSNKGGDWQRQWPKWNVTRNKRWNWSSCTKLALSGSWTHELIAQSFRVSERSLVVLGANLTQANFL